MVDEKLARENEEARRIGDKQMAAAKKLADETEWANNIAFRQKEKKEFQAQKAEMLRQLERDKMERFGGKIPESAQTKQNQKTPLEQVEHGIKTVTTLYTEIRAPGVAKTCLKTCSVFMGNVLKDTSNEKFRRINLDNEAVQKRIAKINGGLLILKGAGFAQATDGTNSLYMTEIDVELLKSAIEKLKPYFEW